MNTIKLKVDAVFADMCQRKNIKIRRADHTGDSCLACVEAGADNAVEVSWDALDTFMDECIQQFKTAPPIWAGRRVHGKNDLVWGKLDRKNRKGILDVEEVLVHYPLIGG